MNPDRLGFGRLVRRPAAVRWLVCSLVAFGLLATGLPSVALADEPAADLYERLDRFACPEVSYIVYGLIPDFFYHAEADSLVDLLAYWEDACGPAEPITRTMILGAIWDGAFDESLYQSHIIDDLIWRFDPVRTGEKPEVVYPELASGGVAHEMDFAEGRDEFDAFTIDLADQLLPHVLPGTLEEFFCLFYSGGTEAAWARLRSDDLVGTDLRWYHDNTLQELDEQRWVPSVAVTGGWWRPDDHLARVGNHATVGVTGALRDRGWLFRVNLDLKLGRAVRPYYISKGDEDGWSDRFNAAWFSGELGRTLLELGRHRLEISGGVGVLSIKPFSESELRINSLTFTLGAGYRLYLGDRHTWFAGLDGQHEWLDEPQTGGTELDGNAWSVRMVVGFTFNQDRSRRLAGLDR